MNSPCVSRRLMNSQNVIKKFKFFVIINILHLFSSNVDIFQISRFYCRISEVDLFMIEFARSTELNPSVFLSLVNRGGIYATNK